jgi:hypothetical protein
MNKNKVNFLMQLRSIPFKGKFNLKGQQTLIQTHPTISISIR